MKMFDGLRLYLSLLFRLDKSSDVQTKIFSISRFMAQGTTLPGDTLIVTAFISYVGCFTKQFRLDLLNKLWLPYLRTLEV